MFYTRLVFKLCLLLFIISGCSQAPIVNDDTTQVSTDNNKVLQELSETNLRKYKEALYALRDNKLDKAQEILVDIIQDHPDIAGPLANMGLIYYKQNKSDQAIAMLQKALLLNPKNAFAHNILGNAFIQQGKFTSAENHFLQAIKFKDDYSNAHYNLALLYDIYFHEIKKSIIHYRKYLLIISDKGIVDKKTADWLEQLENSIKKNKNV